MLNIHRLKVKLQWHWTRPSSSVCALAGKNRLGYQLSLGRGCVAVVKLRTDRTTCPRCGSPLLKQSEYEVREDVSSVRLLMAVTDELHLDSVSEREATSDWWRSPSVTLALAETWDKDIVHLWFIQPDGKNFEWKNELSLWWGKLEQFFLAGNEVC